MTPGWPGELWATTGHHCRMSAPGVSAIVMTILDLMKATLICGAFAYLIYSFPLLGQIVLIGFLGLLWLSYARKTIAGLLRR
jgi:hypothetical protein